MGSVISVQPLRRGPRAVVLRLLACGALVSAALACAGSEAPRGHAKLGPAVGVRPLAGRWHRLVAGDSLGALAERSGADLDAIEELNGLDRRDPLPLGSMIFLPAAPAGARRAGPATRPAKRPTRSLVVSTRQPLLWPVAGGRLTSRFGRRGKRVHEGIDIAGKAGSAVLAAAAGRVIYAGSGLRGYGNLVIVKHPNGLVTVYAHNKRNRVREGQEVVRGTQVAELGSTGRTSGPHVHFEVRVGERPVDPQPYFARPRSRLQ